MGLLFFMCKRQFIIDTAIYICCMLLKTNYNETGIKQKKVVII